MSKLSGGSINPLIGAAGVSAVPMAARVVNKVGLEANPHNFLHKCIAVQGAIYLPLFYCMAFVQKKAF